METLFLFTGNMFYREDTTGYESLIKDNYDYYKEYINNRCFVFVIGNKNLLVVVESNNLKHLLGIEYTTENFFFYEKPESIFSIIGEGEKANGIFEFINKGKYENGELSKQEVDFIKKNECFIELFDSLLQKKDNKLELYLYSKKDGDIFDSDYLYLELVYNGEVKGYIGLKGENKRDIFRFNSVYIDSENRISGKRVDVSNLFIEEINFINKIECNNIIQSPRNINHINKKKHKEKKFKLDNKLINKINKQLRNGYLLKRGNEKATQYNLMKNKNTIIKNFQNAIHWKNEKEIIDYIYNKYPDSKKIKK